MMRFFFLLLFPACTFLFTCLSALPEIKANAYILIDEQSGEVLLEKNSHLPQFPASVTKIATALLALEKGMDIQQKVVVKRWEVGSISSEKKIRARYQHPSYWIEVASSHIGLKVGEEVSFEDLYYGLLLESGNDAANVIAANLSKDIESFMQELNIYLKDLGCQNTHFTNPHGLHHPKHITTAYDLALMTKKALTFPLFCKAIKTLVYTKEATNKQKMTRFSQSNRLIKKGKYYYPYAIGVKTGRTNMAKNTFVAAAEKEGVLLIAVTLKSPRASDAYRGAKALFEWGFEQKKHRPVSKPVTRVAEPVSKITMPISKPVSKVTVLKKGFQDDWGYESPEQSLKLPVFLRQDVLLDTKSYESKNYEIHVKWHPLSLPLKKGKELGVLSLKSPEGKLLQTVEVYAWKAYAKPSFTIFHYVPPSLIFALGFLSVVYGLTWLKSSSRYR